MKVINLERDSKPLFDVSSYFGTKPFSNPRLEQKQVIPLIMQEIAEGQENIIIESPTGSGKSAFAYLIPQITRLDAYVLTHLKGLQDQYASELPEMKVVKGRGNYSCNLDVPPNCFDEELVDEALKLAENSGGNYSDRCSADVAPCTTLKNFNCSFKFSIEDLIENRMKVSDIPTDFCGYYWDLGMALESNFFLTNMNYMASVWPHGYIPQRDLLIVDEAHNLESSLMGHFTLDFSLSDLEKFFGLPTFKEDKGSRLKMLEAWKPSESIKRCMGIPSVPSITTATNERIWKMSAKVFTAYFKELSRVLSKRLLNEKIAEDDVKEANLLLNKLNLLALRMENWKNWVWNKDDELNPRRITFKPLSIKKDAESLIHTSGKQRIFMSATIGDADVFCEELGINSDKTTFIRINYSSFPIENRPIYTHIVGGNLSFKGRTEKDYYLTAKAIKQILWKYPNQKGLILPYTKSNQELLIDSLNKHFPMVARRLRTHSDESKQREEDFKSFDLLNSDDVMISTYANQGYDGKDVAFCIILKVPFRSLGDIQIKKRSELNPKWYKSHTANTLTQMCGRVVRGKENIGHTYIIDPSFTFHYQKGFGNGSLKTEMPKYVCESIESNR
mgnify:CR=1 FL=1